MTRTRSANATPPTPLSAALTAARARRHKPGKPDEQETQATIAAEVGVKQATVSGWERGENKPTFNRLAKVAESYRIAESRLRSLWLKTADAETREAA